MNEMQTLLSDTVTRLFTDRVTTDLRESAEKGQWPAKLWQAVEEGGLTLTPIPEARGGGGGTWQDAYIVVAAAGRFGVPLPIAETMVGGVAPGRDRARRAARAAHAWRRCTRARAELERDGSGWRLGGTAPRVPGAAGPSTSSSSRGGHGRARPGGRRQREGRRQPGARAEGHAAWTRRAVTAAAPAGRAARRRASAIRRPVRSAQMAGGLEYLLAQTVRYVSERKQFGRPIGGFQAIQHNLALLADHTAAAGIAATNAFRAADRGDAAFEIAAAKVRTGEAAGLGAGIAHQCHGAIGFTYEHSLHFVDTPALVVARGVRGREPLGRALGRQVAGRGADKLWPHLTAR